MKVLLSSKKNKKLFQLLKEKQIKDVKEVLVDVTENQTHVHESNMQLEASRPRTVEDGLRELQFKYNDLQAACDSLEMKYDSLRLILTRANNENKSTTCL